jgi:nitrite reductase (NO-forming)
MSDSAGTTERPPDPEDYAASGGGGAAPPFMTAPAAPPDGWGPRSAERAKIGPVRMIVIAVALVVGAVSSVVWALGPAHDHHAAGPASAGPARGHQAAAPPPHRGAHAGAAAGAAKRVAYERYRRPDPTLPPVPPGAVKRFRVDVLMHRTKVAADRPPLRVWSFGVNGRFMRGTGVSPPMVVEQGDRVDVTFVNGASRAMHVTMPHSLDMHAAQIAPNVAFKTIPPRATTHYSFVARDPGVFMYHCATEPMVWHLGSGMVGMFVVKPRNLPKVDRELWLVQQEYYLPHAAGADPDYEKMVAERPDVIAFNGYADQYVKHPIHARAGERVRMYVLNPGPSHTSSFHVIGAIFDRTRSEGMTGGPAQTLALAPSTGGSVDFTLRQEGAYPFVDHNFASMAKGAMGALVTAHAPPGALSAF